MAKIAIFDRLISPKLDFTWNMDGCTIIKFQQSEALTSHFESFWSIVWNQISAFGIILLQINFSNHVLQGTRSYVAHAMDDHGLNTDDAMISYEKQYLVRRKKVLDIINDQAEIKRIK